MNSRIKLNFCRIFETISRYTVLTISILILLVLTLFSVIYTAKILPNEVTAFQRQSLISSLLPILFLMAAGILFLRKKDKFRLNGRAFYIVISAITIIYAFHILSVSLLPVHDQKNCLTIASDLLSGKYDGWDIGRYAYRYPNQNGLILFFAAVQYVFGKGNVLVVQFLNLIFAVLGALYTSLLFNKLGILKNQKLIVLLLMLYAPMMFYITFAYGNIPGYSFAAAAVYYQIKYFAENKLKFFIYSSIFFTVAALFKSNYLIFLVGGVILYIFHALYKKKLKAGLCAVILSIMYLTANMLVEESIEIITDKNIAGQGIPSIAWVTMGLQEGDLAPGWYNHYNYDTYKEAEYDSKKTENLALQDLKERLNFFKENPEYTTEFFTKKVVSSWCEPSFQSLWIQETRNTAIEQSAFIRSLIYNGNTINNIYLHIFDIIQTFIYLFTLIFLYKNRKSITVYQLAPVIVFIGGFIFHIFWETKSQYTISYFFLIIPYALKGYFQTIESVDQKIRKVQNSI